MADDPPPPPLAMDQLAFDSIVMPGLRPGRYLTIQQRYEEWRATGDGKAAYRAIRGEALRLLRIGWRHYGIARIYEGIRYQRDVRLGPDAEGFILNNNWRSRIARELMAELPELAGFFEIRGLRA